jgi:hypothetical protein
MFNNSICQFTGATTGSLCGVSSDGSTNSYHHDGGLSLACQRLAICSSLTARQLLLRHVAARLLLLLLLLLARPANVSLCVSISLLLLQLIVS